MRKSIVLFPKLLRFPRLPTGGSIYSRLPVQKSPLKIRSTL